MMVCLVALLALPTAAHAAAPFAGEYPAPGLTVHASPSVIAVDLIGVSVKPGATITVGGNTYPVVPISQTAAGSWSSQEIDNGSGYFTIHWTWTAGTASGKVSLYCTPSTLATSATPYSVTVNATQSDGTALSDSWTFTVADNGTAPGGGTTPVAFDDLTCTTNSACHVHSYAAFANDNAMGPKCTFCHSDGFEPKHTLTPSATDVGTAHATLIANLNSGKSKACTACHGNDVMGVATKVAGTPVTYTVPNVGGTLEHNGCSCHQYGEADPGKTCVDCHTGAYGAIHGWANAVGPYNSELHTVSGHNTTSYGTVGARTDFSSLGITDTVGAAPAAQFPLTVNNTFKAGYSWNSVITCEDCHTGLVASEVAGPHGGNAIANWGIDPAYTGSFATASLWGGTYTVGASSMANATTLTIGPFAEGIAQWAPGVADSQELSEYQVIQPDMGTAASTKFVAGTASVSAGNVICVKCHDLYDATKNTGFKGWGNYAHEHHSADTGSFKMYFGKFEVGDGGVSVTSQTVVADNATDAMAQLPGATKNKQIIAPSLGREDAGACRNCHIAIPHGWKRPKLIVYSNLPDPTTGYRASLGLPASGDSAPYNIGPAVYEGEALNGTAVGSGQMNGLASGIVHVKEAQTLLDGSTYTTAGTLPSQLLVEEEDYPALVSLNRNPLNGFTGDQYVNWNTAQCNACGHHSSTSFANPSATQPPLAWNSRENNWTSTKPANGAWK